MPEATCNRSRVNTNRRKAKEATDPQASPDLSRKIEDAGVSGGQFKNNIEQLKKQEANSPGASSQVRFVSTVARRLRILGVLASDQPLLL